jgi:hypothetical protein
MQPPDVPSFKPEVPNRGRRIFGEVLIVGAVLLGGLWTFAMLLGEALMMGTGRPHRGPDIPIGTIITGVASLLLLAAGIRLTLSGNTAAMAQNVAATAGWLAAAAAACYVLGFAVCLAR